MGQGIGLGKLEPEIIWKQIVPTHALVFVVILMGGGRLFPNEAAFAWSGPVARIARVRKALNEGDVPDLLGGLRGEGRSFKE